MRALLVLIKKHIADDAPYLAGALALSVLLLIALGCLGFIYPEDLQLYIFVLLIAMPALVSVCCFTFGMAQMFSQVTRGSTPFVSLLPVALNQVLLSRVISGTLVIFAIIAVLAIGITAGVVSELVLWPESLFPGGLFDLFAGMFLVGLACYCSGLYVAQRAQTFSSALGTLPLALILYLLVIIKGFGAPLACVTVLFICASLLCLLRPSARCHTATIARAFIVMVLLGIPLFWGRCLCKSALVGRLPPGADDIEISDSGLLPRQEERGPDSKPTIGASAHIGSFTLRTRWSRWRKYDISYTLACLGIIDYVQLGEPSDEIDLDRIVPYSGIYFDEARGLVVSRGVGHEFYIGPQGMSETPDNKLGRFLSPIIVCSEIWGGWLALYDHGTNCFFAIDIKERTVRKGPKLMEAECRPIDIIGSRYWSGDCSVSFAQPYGAYSQMVHGTERYLLVVYDSGQADLLDRQTLEILGPAGCLPRPRTLFGWGPGRPKNLLAYDAELLAEGKAGTYIGMAVASLSRQGTSMALAVFDKDGNMVKTAHTEANLFDVPWGPALAGAKFLFESLHPPVLTLASYFTAYSFEARSTHRALFLMPNSFVAMVRDYQGNIFYALLIVTLLMLPAILFAGLLAWRVDRDGARLGLSPNARRLWLLGMLAFGLAGYITYRLTRPKVALVTCANCGHPRRPDMDKCHRCGSDWHVPELTPPVWRVLDGGGTERTR